MVHVIYPDNYYASDERIKSMAADVLVDEQIKTDDYKAVSNLWHETESNISLDEAIFVLEDRGLITVARR